LFLLFAVASAQFTRTEIRRAVRITLRFGFTRCRLTLGRSLCSFARQIVDLVLDGDLVGELDEDVLADELTDVLTDEYPDEVGQRDTSKIIN
jgi:hypothetical protein